MMQKAYEKHDVRVARTQKLIFDALIQCTLKKGFSAVTVSDITQTAAVNRATFYRHYKDKLDLLDHYTQTVYTMLAMQDTTVTKRDVHAIPQSLLAIFKHIQDNALFYQVMLGENGAPGFGEKIRTYIKKRIRNSLPTNIQVDEKMKDLFVTYSANASFGAVVWWLEHDMPYSAEDILSIIRQLETENLNWIKALK